MQFNSNWGKYRDGRYSLILVQFFRKFKVVQKAVNVILIWKIWVKKYFLNPLWYSSRLIYLNATLTTSLPLLRWRTRCSSIAIEGYIWMEGIHLCLVNFLEKSIQAGLEAVFPVPMPGDSGLSPDAGSISNYCLTQEIFTPTPAYCCPSISLKQCFGQ